MDRWVRNQVLGPLETHVRNSLARRDLHNPIPAAADQLLLVGFDT